MRPGSPISLLKGHARPRVKFATTASTWSVGGGEKASTLPDMHACMHAYTGSVG